MNGISKRGVLSLGLCDIPQKERFWHFVKNFAGAFLITGAALAALMPLIWWWAR